MFLHNLFFFFGAEVATMQAQVDKVIFPPRPKGKIYHKDLNFYEKSGQWVAQLKFNGSRNLIHILPDKKVLFWSRDGDFHKKPMPKNLAEEILNNLKLEDGLEYWLDSEFLNKTKNAGNQIVLFDILQAGKYFFGKPNQMERLSILSQICNFPSKKNDIAFEISENIWLAETFASGFVVKFREHDKDDRIEGLVLRRKVSVIQSFGNKYYETGDQIRCRKEKKNYNF